MGRFLFSISTFAAIFSVGVAHAQLKPVDPADIQAVTNILSGYVKTLDQTFYVYNWSNADRRDPIWTTALSATSGAGLDHLKSGTQRYWDSFCSRDASLNPLDCAGVVVKQSLVQIDNTPAPDADRRGTLLWPDLDGMAPDANLSGWIQNNLYGCKSPSNSEAK